MAKRLKTHGWMTIWKVDLGDDGGLPTAHWSATGKFSAGGKHYFTLDSHWNTGTHCFDARRITLECWQKFHWHRHWEVKHIILRWNTGAHYIMVSPVLVQCVYYLHWDTLTDGTLLFMGTLHLFVDIHWRLHCLWHQESWQDAGQPVHIKSHYKISCATCWRWLWQGKTPKQDPG